MLLLPNKKILRPYEKPSFEHTQKYGLDWQNAKVSLEGCVFYGLMNEGSGNIVQDLSGNGNTGTLVGTASWISSPMGPAVNTDDAAGNRIEIAAGGSYPFTNGFTWVIWGIVNTWPVAAWEYDDWTFGYIDANNRIELRIGNNGDPTPRLQGSVEANNVSKAVNYSLASAIIGVPMMMALTYDKANVRLYFDGLDVGSIAQTESFTANMGLRALGYTCDMKTIAAYEYSHALSASEIAQLKREPFCQVWQPKTQIVVGWVSGGAPPAGIPILRRRRECA